jgi:hypothetical protein
MVFFKRPASRPSPAPTIEYIIVAERGLLEYQALLLCESIRRFAGRHAGHRISVVSPRPDRRPEPHTIRQFEALACTYIELDVKSVEPEYGTTFRMYASAHVEATSQADILVALDSDMVFAGEPDLDLHGAAAAMRPVDVRGMCTTGLGHHADPYWRQLCSLVGVDYDALPYVHTTVDNERVKASYNGGMVVVRRRETIFQRTLDHFIRSTGAGLTPRPDDTTIINAGHGLVSARGSELWGTSQACLSVAIWGHGRKVRLLPATHNVPMHMFDQLSDAARAELPVVLHYHRLFEMHPALNPILNGEVPLTPEFAAWIHERAATPHGQAQFEAAGSEG